MSSVWMVMIAVFAPVVLGLVTLWLPREWIERRMAIAGVDVLAKLPHP